MTTERSASADDLQDKIETLEEELSEKAAHPLELFFDLVFVFAITQVASLVVHDLTLAGVLRGALVLAIVCWAWTNWTWTTNVVDLEPRAIRVASHPDPSSCRASVRSHSRSLVVSRPFSSSDAPIPEDYDPESHAIAVQSRALGVFYSLDEPHPGPWDLTGKLLPELES